MAKNATAVHEQNAAKLPQAKDDHYDTTAGFLIGKQERRRYIRVALHTTCAPRSAILRSSSPQLVKSATCETI